MFLIHMLIANLKNGNPLPICYINETFHKNKDAKNSNLYSETFLEKYTYVHKCMYLYKQYADVRLHSPTPTSQSGI